MMKKTTIVRGGIVLFLIFLAIYYWKFPLAQRVSIKGHVFTVELAVTPQEQQRGLGNRDTLAHDRGMLFPYLTAQQYGFWMKDMRFPIDIIWIRDNSIVDITKNAPVPTDTNLPVYQPQEPANKVLEINAGLSDEFGFAIGDTVQILKR